MAFGRFLKEIIDEKGINQAELSRRTGIPKTTLNGIFKADTDKISVNLFIDICDAVDIEPNEFLRKYYKNSIHPSVNLSFDEQHLIELFRLLTPKEQGNIIGRAELLVEQHREAEAEEGAS